MQPTEDQIADYLSADPQFFERNAQLLNEIHLPSPHGSGTVSLAERQQLAQRDKIRVLEVKLSELLQFGEENDVISAKVHRLCVDLLGAHDLDSLVNLALDNLRENFSVPHVAIRLWAQAENPQDAANPVFTPLDAPARAWSELLATP